jgi:lipoyl(octanoyl) transferase
MPTIESNWKVVDSGPLSGEDNMAIDRVALEDMQAGKFDAPLLRLFRWAEPTVTYGYLLDPAKVKEWAKPYGDVPVVKRPSGGGAVYHTPNDLSLSLLWPRSSKMFSDHPRECYAQIHEIILSVIARRVSQRRSNPLYLKQRDCFAPPRGSRNDSVLPVCFQEPVCNDIMLGGKKIVGGALRITKQAILYQGTVQYGT